MEWSEPGIVLSVRRHGESSAIVSLFTRGHGRHLGLVRGGAGRRQRGMLQPGNLVGATWRARLPEHLGNLVCEPAEAFSARVLEEPGRLEAMVASLAVLDSALAEHEAHADLYDATIDMLRILAGPPPPSEVGAGAPAWAISYVRWEVRCLAEFGFGLDLARGEMAARPVWVSPRTGRAVGAEQGAPYASRLLALPAFLTLGGRGEETVTQAGTPSAADIRAGLELTGHFLERHVLGPQERDLPAARRRLLERWRRLATTSGG